MSTNYTEQFITTPSANSIPDNLKASNYLDDDLLNSVGLYSKKDIDEAKFTRFSRFGRILDPQGKVNDGREYLFFVKPDLHIAKTNSDEIYHISGDEYTGEPIRYNGLTLNPQLGNSAYFQSLIWSHPNVVQELQSSAIRTDGKSLVDQNDPFCHLLSSTVNSYLDMPSGEASTLDNSSTMLGATYDYLKDAENSDENPTFSLDFLDTKHLDVYQFFRAYSEYHIVRKSGLVTPPSMNYYWYKRLHNTMGIYKFIVSEDMETILYWAYYWGVYPTSVPREAFSDPLFNEGLTFSVNFKAAFVQDMDPLILADFNSLMSPLIKDTKAWMPVVIQNFNDDIDANGYRHSYNPNMNSSIDSSLRATDPKRENGITNAPSNNPSSRIDGRLPKHALVTKEEITSGEGLNRYKLRWYLD